MHILSQLPGTEDAIKAAASRGWEAVLLVVIVVSTFGFFGWMLRRILDSSDQRETRLSNRVTALECEIRTELFAQMKANSEIMTKMCDAANRICIAADRMIQTLERFETTLASRPCLATMRDYARDVADELAETALIAAERLKDTARGTASELKKNGA